VSRVIAVAAMLAVIAGFGGVTLVMHGGHTSTTNQRGAGSTSATAQRGRWIELTALADPARIGGGDLPAMAPSDPQVVYEANVTDSKGLLAHKPATLWRTDNGGTTWTQLPLPLPTSNIDAAGIAVSPNDPHTVFLVLVDSSAADCPANTQIKNVEAGAGVLCWVQYTSTDGGEHWTATRLPLQGGKAGYLSGGVTNGGGTPITSGTLRAQGSRLYAGYMCADNSCLRLVTSTDGGVSWQFADQQIMGEGTSMCDFTTSSRGSTVFAVTSTAECPPAPTQSPLTLWQSQDAGQHWTRMGTIPTPNEQGMMLVSGAGSGAPLLYLAAPRTTAMVPNKLGMKTPVISDAPSDIKVSADGGRTWENAPSAGIPNGLKPVMNFDFLGHLRDGSIVVEFSPNGYSENGGTLFTWKRGESSWHQIAPPVQRTIGVLVVAQSPQTGHEVLYLTMVNRGYPDNRQTNIWFLRDEL
jgi:photosystem II stability/assembly factor-like uncharacterized protein